MRAEAFLLKAGRSFRAADRLLADGDLDFCLSRVYYGYFYVVSALLGHHGLEFRSHRAVIAQYGLLFGRPRILDRVFHRSLIEAARLRREADYEPDFDPNREVVVTLIAEGRCFLAAAAADLAEP